MSKCCQCKQPVATELKLRCLFLKEAEYCPNCGAELSLFSFWTAFGLVISVWGPIVIAIYLSKNTQSFNGMFLLPWIVLTLLSFWLTTLLSPLVPYKDRSVLILKIFFSMIFTFFGVIVLLQLYQSSVA